MLTPILIAAGAFAVLLFLIARLQRPVRRAADAEVEREIAAAKLRGSDRPLNQHPLIDPELCAGCALCVAACPEDQVLGMLHGRAVIVHGARCVGHGLCAEVCPVNAITIGLGALAEREDVPRLSAEFESSVPGLFVVGELGGLALIRNAVDQGAAAISTIAMRLARSQERAGDTLDVAIVGCGPAGLAAALKAHEVELRYALIEQETSLGGTLLHYPRQKLTLLQAFTLPLFGKVKAQELEKEQVLALFQQVVDAHHLNVRFGERLLSVQRDQETFAITTSKGTLRARCVVLAMGRRGTPRKLDVPGEHLPKVAYRLTDAASYHGRNALVVGGGDSAVEAALALAAQPRNRVTLSYRKDGFFRLKANNERRIEQARQSGKVNAVFGSQVLEILPHAVRLQTPSGETTLDNDFVFVFAGGVAPFEPLKEAGVKFGGEPTHEPSSQRR